MADRSKSSMQPLPETRRALEELGRTDAEDLVAAFQDSVDRVNELVPSCVGVSISVVKEGLTFTWLSTGSEAPTLDAVQYLAGGPCLEAVERVEVVESGSDELLDEGRWLALARAEKANGIATSLSMPMMEGDTVVGFVNLYAASEGAFHGQHEAIGQLFGAWVPGAVTNADLSFTTRELAMQAPATMRGQSEVNQAVGMIVAAHSVSTQEARARLRRAAARAGLSEEEVAGYVVRTRLL